MSTSEDKEQRKIAAFGYRTRRLRNKFSSCMSGCPDLPRKMVAVMRQRRLYRPSSSHSTVSHCADTSIKTAFYIACTWSLYRSVGAGDVTQWNYDRTEHSIVSRQKSITGHILKPPFIGTLNSVHTSLIQLCMNTQADIISKKNETYKSY